MVRDARPLMHVAGLHQGRLVLVNSVSPDLTWENLPTIAVSSSRMRGIQYAAASRFNHWRLWNTGSPTFAGC
jgi:hypothetical protein